MKRTVAIVLLLFVLASRGEAAPQAFQVSYATLGPATAAETDKVAGHFVSRLNARAEFDAAAAGALAAREDWLLPPDGVKPADWISVVTVCFGPRVDWIAFTFDAEGAPSFAARRQAKKRTLTGVFPHSIPPGPEQIDRNAAIELAADFGNEFPARNPSAPRLRVAVTAPSQAKNQSDDLQAMLGKGSADAEEQDASLSPQELDGFKALVFAVVCRAGRKPVDGAADAALELAVTRQVLSYTVSATWSGGSATRKVVKKGIRQDSIFDSLQSLIPALLAGGDFVDFARVSEWPSRLVALDGQRLIVQREGELRAFDLFAGEQLWQVLPSPTAQVQPRYAGRELGGGTGAVFRIAPSVTAIVTATGAPRDGKGEAPAATWPWGFDTAPDGRLAAADAAGLAYAARGAPPWTFKAQDDLTCGPLLVEGGVLVGGQEGALFCLAAKDGAVRWKQATGERLQGPIARVGSLVFAASIEGTLFAWSAKDGAPAWRQPIGDCLLEPIRTVGEHLLVATRNNVVRLLDPRDGSAKAKREWTGWLASVGVAGNPPLVLCAERSGTVTLLSLPDLKTVRAFELRTKLVPGMACGPDVPYRLGQGDDFGDKGPAAVVADERGFVFVVPAATR